MVTLTVVLVLASGLSPAWAQETGRITGQVHDEVGAALPNAVVTLSGEQGARNAVTDDAGRFAFDDVLAGSYSVVRQQDSLNSYSNSFRIWQ